MFNDVLTSLPVFLLVHFDSHFQIYFCSMIRFENSQEQTQATIFLGIEKFQKKWKPFVFQKYFQVVFRGNLGTYNLLDFAKHLRQYLLRCRQSGDRQRQYYWIFLNLQELKNFERLIWSLDLKRRFLKFYFYFTGRFLTYRRITKVK